MKKKLLLAPLMAVLVACVVVLSGCGGPSVEELITEDLTTQFEAYRTKCVSTLGASAQVDAPFSAV